MPSDSKYSGCDIRRMRHAVLSLLTTYLSGATTGGVSSGGIDPVSCITSAALLASSIYLDVLC